MTIIVTNDTPPAIRGMLKRWFIEPKPNVFVGSVNRRTRGKTLEFIRRNAPGLGMLVIATERNAQGFFVETYGETPRRAAMRSGLQVMAEAWAESEGEEDDAC
ncbi:MAG: type I-E CRISPR-associated endoribonuclease Cas2e [Kiritimatiellae bacterium]|nr:type I-E CRISPR-associated endoribonuclease Cas2e [Kiritimatiellia bacterium]MCO5060751.1 type I-E CRISPR-associated endoribonuclease Cas2e [Kiritimatiellia bacterium]MCO6399888.1 type I-E CRISPR-associated endoribonuclease Cas2 [Verrucomicrobiota bacterium]